MKHLACNITVAFFLGLFASIAWAADVANSQEISTKTINSQENNSIVGAAKDWELTDSEWARYVQLMNGVNGHWYPHLTPPAVLGLNAASVEDRQHFAEIAAHQEHDKIERELAFNQAFYRAMRQLYPNEPMIRDFDKTPFNPQQTSK